MAPEKGKEQLSDAAAITGMQDRNTVIERRFYLDCRAFFRTACGTVLDYRIEAAREAEDLFQDSFLKLWTEISAHRIYVADGVIYRVDRAGTPRPMTASLKTYMMGIARYRNYEFLREEEIYGQLPQGGASGMEDGGAEIPEEHLRKEWVVEDCINTLSDSCREILRLFYYEKKSLDEIMLLRGNSNKSKDGLKTRKSKCISSLKKRVSEALIKNNLKLYANEPRTKK